MNLDLKIKNYPVSVRVEDDQLFLKGVDGSESNSGRLSGYSDSELIKPTINADGTFEWFDPALNPQGKVFVKPEKRNVQIYNPVSAMGIYAGKFEYDFVSDRLMDYEYKMEKDNFLFYFSRVTNFNAGKSELELDITVSTNVSGNVYPGYLFQENNNGFVLYQEGNGTGTYYFNMDFPYPVSMDGLFIVSSSSGQNGREIRIETSLDMISWTEQGIFKSQHNGKYRYNDYIFDEDAEVNDRDNLFFFENTVRAKFVRLSVVDTSVTLKLFSPFKDTRSLEKITLHKYDDVNIDPNSFTLTETEDSISLSTVEQSESNELELPRDSRTLEKAIFLKGTVVQNLKKNKIVRFDEDKEFAPGVSATIPYSNLGGGITLEAGNYEIEIDMELYGNDYRQFYGEIFNISSQTIGFMFTDAISNKQLSETQAGRIGAYEPILDDIEYTYSDNITRGVDDPLGTIESFSTSWPYAMRTATEAEVMIAVPANKTVGSFTIVQGTDSYNFRSMTFFGLEDDESWTEIEKFDTNGFSKNTVNELKLPSPSSYRKYKVVLEPLVVNRYSYVCRIIPEFLEASNVIKPRFKMITQLALSGKTTLVFKHASGAPTTVYNRTMEIYKLGEASLSETYEDEFWDKPLSQFKIYESDVKFNCLNNPIGYPSYLEMSLDKGDTFSIYFPGPVKLYRRGVEANKEEGAPFKITASSSEREDVSYLNYSPYSLEHDGLTLFDGSGQNPVNPRTQSVTDSSPSHMLVRDVYNNLYDYVTSNPEDESVTVTVTYNDEITVNGIKERLVDEYKKVNDVYTGSPKDIVVEALNLETDTWEEVGKIDEQYKMSLDGTPRSGAGNYDGTTRILGDGKTRFYPLDRTVTSTTFRFTIHTSAIGRVTALRTLSVVHYEEDYDFSTYSDSYLQYARWNEVIQFSDVMPAGTYIFEATGKRTDSEWYIESATGEI